MSIDSIGQRRCDSCHRTKLTASSSPKKFLVSDGGVVNHSCQLDIVVRALSSLKSSAETPGPRFAILVDSNAMIRTSCSVNRSKDVFRLPSSAIMGCESFVSSEELSLMTKKQGKGDMDAFRVFARLHADYG